MLLSGNLNGLLWTIVHVWLFKDPKILKNEHRIFESGRCKHFFQNHPVVKILAV